MNAAQPGDVISVFDGTCQGCKVSKSGAAGKPITIKAGGENVVINREGSAGDGIYLSNVSHIAIDGFIIQDVSGRCISAHDASPTDPMINVTIQNVTCRVLLFATKSHRNKSAVSLQVG